jgi:hypothetical protein
MPLPRFFLAALALHAIALLPALAEPPPKVRTPSVEDAGHPPHQPRETRVIRKTQVLRESGVYDFKFALLRWRGKGKCNQKEGQAPMFDIRGKRIILRNAFILDAPDGIHVSGRDVKIENVYFMNVCEDAITASGAVDLDIANCYFYDAEDKILQLNEGRDIEIYGNVFNRFASAIRVKDAAEAVQVRNNLFLDGKRAIFSDGKHADVSYVGENLAVRVNIFALAEDKSNIRLENGNRFQQVGERLKESGGGRVKE